MKVTEDESSHHNPTNCHACTDGEYGAMLELLQTNVYTKWYVDEHSDLVDGKFGPGDLRDVFICLNPVCKHVYRNYHGNSADWHSSGYRQEQYDATSDASLHLGSPKVQAERIKKVKRQLHLMKPFMSKSDNIFEVASGKGYFLRVIKKDFPNIVGSDIDPKVISHNAIYNPDVKMILSDVIKLPEDKKHDVVIAMDVLEHVENAREFANKMHALTKRYVIIQVPTKRYLKCPNDPELQGGKEFDGHLHYFSRFSLNNLFTENNMFKCAFMYESWPGDLAHGCELFAVYEKV